MRHPFTPLPRPAPRGEAGSAYLIAISALAVLSLIGLALIAVTQTEVEIGASERTANRLFYAADSGFAVAVARPLVDGAYKAVTFTVQDSVAGSPVVANNQVSMSPFYPINDQPCNLCEINDAGEYSDHSYRKINHAVTASTTRTATALGILGATPVTAAQKRLTVMFEFQPWKSSPEAYAAANDPTQLANIKF
jgi:Tfp pilus assembly protein PilX